MNWLFGGLGYLLGRGAGAGLPALTVFGSCFTTVLSVIVLYFMTVGMIQNYVEAKHVERVQNNAGTSWIRTVTKTALPRWRQSNPNIENIVQSYHGLSVYNPEMEDLSGFGDTELPDGRVVGYDMGLKAKWWKKGWVGPFNIVYTNGNVHEAGVRIIMREENVGEDDSGLKIAYFQLIDITNDYKAVATIDNLGDVSEDMAEAAQDKAEYEASQR